jgi:quinol monooxygenase YgiN
MKIIIKYLAKPQHKDALEKALRSIIVITRKAHGCVQCDLHPSLDNRLVLFFDQLWESEDSWKQYLERNHMQEFTNQTEAMIDTIDICVSEY